MTGSRGFGIAMLTLGVFTTLGIIIMTAVTSEIKLEKLPL